MIEAHDWHKDDSDDNAMYSIGFGLQRRCNGDYRVETVYLARGRIPGQRPHLGTKRSFSAFSISGAC